MTSNTTLNNKTNLHMELRHQGIDKPSSRLPDPILSSHKPNWWKTTTVYQIWPASFKDSNGDGLGDISGIISKLDYLHSLGAQTIWLSPMYDGPQQDMGYDISDYTAIYPPYGTMADMDALIKGLHDRGMKIILDLVVNHTSDQHHWFKESCKSRHNKHADWYIWRHGKKGRDPKTNEEIRLPPNNWGSVFGGSAWKWMESRQQFYLHMFADGQPDLNWENDATRHAVHEQAIRFWLVKGVDGFRVDTCNIYSKVQSDLEKDAPVNGGMAPYGDPSASIINGPRMHEFWQEIREKVLNDFGDPLMVGELALSSVEETLKYVGRKPRELSMVFDFAYSELGREERLPHLTHPYTLPEAKAALRRTQDYVVTPLAWTSIFKENHDRPRSVSYHGTTNPKYWAMAAKLLAMMTGTLSGTLFLYQGEEIGMTNINPDTWKPSDLKDIASLNYLQTIREQYPNDAVMWEKAWRSICFVGRDNARTPVQWSGEEFAGFTKGKGTWMRVNENFKEGINVAAEEKDDGSVLNFWREMLKVRREHEDVFVLGGYKVLDEANEQTWTFEKSGEGRKAWVVLNFSGKEAEVEVPKGAGTLLLSNAKEPGKKLQAWEGRIYK